MERISENPRVKGALKKSEEPGISWVRCFIRKAWALEKTKVRVRERTRSKVKMEGRAVGVVTSERIKSVRKIRV